MKIMNFALIIAMMFYILCNAIEDFYLGVDYSDPKVAEAHIDAFIPYYKLQYNTAARNLVILKYFSFTSLSTVGFGDYVPRSNFERLAGALLLLTGVAIFSIIMGQFIDILNEFQEFNSDFNEGDKLTKFFGTIKKFNFNNDIDQQLKEQIETHFEYRWANDRNSVFLSKQGKNFMAQIPDNIINQIMTEYMFSDFLKAFSDVFRVKNKTKSIVVKNDDDELIKLENVPFSW